jgi:hypothetical protein
MLLLTQQRDPDGDAAWFLAALQEFETGAPYQQRRTLDDILGLKLAPGETGWWEAEKLARRDALLRQIRARYFPTLSQRAAAQAIRDALTRYETTQWKKHSAFTSVPTLRGIDVELFKLLKLRVPLSFGTIRPLLDVANHEAVFVGQPSPDTLPKLEAPPAEDTHGSHQDEVTPATRPR